VLLFSILRDMRVLMVARSVTAFMILTAALDSPDSPTHNNDRPLCTDPVDGPVSTGHPSVGLLNAMTR